MGKIVLPSKGINLAPGTLARGEGAVTQLDNWVVDAPGVYRSRQGNTRQSNQLGGPVWKMISDKLLNTNLLVNHGTNLLANALAVTPSGGHVWLSATAGPLAAPGVAAPVILAVTDDGPGFPPGVADHVFESLARAILTGDFPSVLSSI